MASIAAIHPLRFKPLLTAEMLSLSLALPVVAQTWPEKTITIVVPTAAGGAIASEYVARAAPDGYTIMFGYIATHGINPALQKPKYDPVADFEPIGMVAASPTVLVASNSVPAKKVKELVQLIKAKPGTFSYASAGNGTAAHIAGELFKLSAGLDVVSIPYKGSAPAIVDTIAGNTQFMFPSLNKAFRTSTCRSGTRCSRPPKRPRQCLTG